MARDDGSAALTLDASLSHPIDPFLQGHPPATQIALARVSLIAFAAAAAGVITAAHAPNTPSWLWFALSACGALTTLALRRKGARAFALALCVALLFAGWLALRAFEVSPRSLERLLTDEPAPLRIEGVVQNAPRVEPAARGELGPYSYQAGAIATRFTLRAERVGSVERSAKRESISSRATGLVRVYVAAPLPELRAGDRIAVSGLASAAGAPTNPGERDNRPWARQRGFAGSIAAPEAALVRPLAPAGARSLRQVLRRIQGALRTRASRAIDAVAQRMDRADARALLRALILGDRSDDLRDVENAARQAGLSHMLAISGLHIGALAYLLLLGLRLTGDRGALEPAAVALLIILYLFILPARTPALRAGIMVLAFLAAEMGGRRYSRLAVLALSALLILLWRPLELFSVGFQLSYTIVAGLILFAPWLDARLPGKRPILTPARARQRRTLWRRLRAFATGAARSARATFIVSLCATLMATPVKMFHMAMLAPLGPFTTTIAMPFLLAALTVGGVALLLGMVAASLTAPLGLLALLALSPMLDLMFAVDAIPFAFWRVPRMSLPWSIAAFALLASAMWGAAGPTRRALIAAAGVFALWTAAALWSGGRLPARVVLRVDMLDVGDGACILLRSGDDAMLWDCGSSNLTIGQWTLPAALRELGAQRVERAIITHADMDHYSALPDLARVIGLKQLFITRAFRADARADPHGPDAHVLAALTRAGVTAQTIAAGSELALGDVCVRFLWPPAHAEPASFSKDNEASLVALVSAPTRAGQRRLLLTGDLEGAPIDALRSGRPELRVHAMELLHHGGFRPASLAFVQALDPQVVMQSTGPSRRNDERWSDARTGRTWLMTAEVGAITLQILRDGSLRTSTIVDRED